MNLSIERVKDALSRSFDEGMSGYAEMKDELLDSLLAELVATSESNNQINIQQSPHYTVCTNSVGSYFYDTSFAPSLTNVDSTDFL